MYFSYNGTRDWFKIEWRDQSCMKLKVVAKNKDNKIPVLLVFSVTQFKIDQNKNQNRSIDKVQNLGNERR